MGTHPEWGLVKAKTHSVDVIILPELSYGTSLLQKKINIMSPVPPQTKLAFGQE